MRVKAINATVEVLSIKDKDLGECLMGSRLESLNARAIFAEGLIQLLFVPLFGYTLQAYGGWGVLIAYIALFIMAIPFLKRIQMVPFGSTAMFLLYWWISSSAYSSDTFSEIAPYYLPFSIGVHSLNIYISGKQARLFSIEQNHKEQQPHNKILAKIGWPLLFIVFICIVGYAANSGQTYQYPTTYSNNQYPTENASLSPVEQSKSTPEQLFQDAERAYLLQNYSQALQYYTDAANQGNKNAALKLAEMYVKGEGTPADYNLAVNWLLPLAKEGNLNAQIDLGLLYATGGNGLGKDYKVSFKWLQQAAEQGNAEAQYYVGLMYLKGLGVKSDKIQAVAWIQKASEQGHIAATSVLTQLNVEAPSLPLNALSPIAPHTEGNLSANQESPATASNSIYPQPTAAKTSHSDNLPNPPVPTNSQSSDGILDRPIQETLKQGD